MTMDTVPPSYESATTRDAWPIIAQYIPSSDLCSVVLVCQRWHAVFMPFLWGNPASHFGTDNDDVYVALTRFRRTLKYARLEVRMLTHTLHMPPALSEIYGGPRPEWLREILDYLPCLQSLIVSELPFFDHSAMMALRSGGRQDQSMDGASSRTYHIRLLMAEREPNATLHGLAESLLHFPDLIYLDLSYNPPARDRMVLSALTQLEHLQVLKLRDIGLKDAEAEFIANAIGLRVRCLDLRNNKLTDMAVRSLLQACFLPPGSSGLYHGPNRKLLASPTLDENFEKALTRPLTGRSWVEDLPNVGITHLYISDNQITVEGVASLLSSTRLHFLDVGTVDTAKYLTAGRGSIFTPDPCKKTLPGAEKLIPILGTLAKENLTYLRAHHPICTADTPQKSFDSSAATHELPTDTNIFKLQELESNERPVYELPADETQIFELPGTPMPQSASRPSSEQLHPPMVNGGTRSPTYEDQPLLMPRRGSVFAPEALENRNEESLGENYSTLERLEGVSSEITPLCSSPLPMDDPRASKIQELLAKRPKRYTPPRRNYGEKIIPYLHPSHIPHLETLVLTDVPSHIPANSPILDSLIRFITACSNEALLATLQAGTDYSLPPGQDRAKAELERARSLFALRQLVLEITPVSSPAKTPNLSTWQSVSSQIGPFKSSTGDRDLEELWSAAIDDFSFFDETECGIPENDPGKYFPMATFSEKVLMISDNGLERSRSSGSNRQRLDPKHREQNPPSLSPPSEVDVVAELAAFRRRKKSEYEQVVRTSSLRRNSSKRLPSRSGTPSPSPSPRASSSTTAPPSSIPHHVEGYWKGEVKIVRNAAPRGRSGVVDMYGNYFEKGYLYP